MTGRGFRPGRRCTDEVLDSGVVSREMPARRTPAPDPQAGTYVVGRPLMFVVWAIALWGTGVALRLAWLAATRGLPAALQFLALPGVSVPVVVALCMWIALLVAVRRFHRHGAP